MKLDRNGIPILDPPGNKIKKRKLCLPDEHHYEMDREQVKDRFPGTSYTCSVCGENDFIPDYNDDGQMDPWT